MVGVLLLVLIYATFVSLGLPDSLLGVSWPLMQSQWNMSTDAAGIVNMFAVGATIVSTLLSGRIIAKLGTGKVVFFSCLLTGLALMGISFTNSFILLIIFAMPLGFGGGSVDAALNNYVANNYKAHHMNWLHSFWGVGATLGPVIMAQILTGGHTWNTGYRTVSIVQLSLAFLLMISLPLWSKNSHKDASHSSKEELSDSKKGLLKIHGVKLSLAIFMLYCTIESAIGLWGSTYLVSIKGVGIDTAAKWIAAYFAGITIGRFLCGFISFKVTNSQMIKSGCLIIIVGTTMLALPISGNFLIAPLMLIGLGLSPIFPAMMHETPRRFGRAPAQHIIGLQMAFAYVGIALLTPGIGVVLDKVSTTLLPYILILVAIVMSIACFSIIHMFKDKKSLID